MKNFLFNDRNELFNESQRPFRMNSVERRRRIAELIEKHLPLFVHNQVEQLKSRRTKRNENFLDDFLSLFYLT